MRRLVSFCFLTAAACALFLCPAAADDYSAFVKELADDLAQAQPRFEQDFSSFQSYDFWYRGYKEKSALLTKQYYQTHKQRASFQKAQEALQVLGKAWGQLKQVRYAQEQYREIITSGSVGEAHRWKEQANELKAQVPLLLNDALEGMREAAAAAEGQD